MSLPTPSLDDRTFQNLVDEAKRRIPELAPEWTDHNVSDPGVALIELFAWMTETLLYRINQVPDRMYVKFLELMGVSLYAPSPAQALLTFRLSAPQEEAVRVPAGIEVATLQTAEHEAVVFHTRRDLMVRPPRLIAALTGSGGQIATYTDRWDDLRFERQGMPCFTDLRVGSAAYFGFQETLADNIVRFEMVASGEGVGVRPDDPPIIWEASHEDQWVPLEVLADTTGGLNRSGVVELQLPPEHA
ncbi:MAG: putative baseplate assembly protein, partial [Dehalococcoidia bacterium]